MLFYLARHGETTANRRRVILGRNDAPLTALGLSVGESLGRILRDRLIGCLFTSPLGRARASAQILAHAVGVVPVPMNELVELACGRWEGRPRDNVLGSRNVIRSTWTDSPPGGESCQDAEARVSRAVDIIQGKLSKSSVLAVGHAGVNRVLLKIWYNLDPVLANELTQPHDLVYVLSVKAPLRWLNAKGDSGMGWGP